MEIEVLHAPAEYTDLKERDLRDRVCVVFDVLRATSTMVTALAEGAASVRPVGSIEAALAVRNQDPSCLLAGERGGLRISAEQTGGVAFDLGNSPREFTRVRVGGRRLVMTTTNGTMAMEACAKAETVIAAAFLNLDAVASWIVSRRPSRVLLVGSGTGSEAAWEDSLAAGALGAMLVKEGGQPSDAARVAMAAWQQAGHDLESALGQGKNGRRLLAMPELRPDVAWCARMGVFDGVPTLQSDGEFRSSA